MIYLLYAQTPNYIPNFPRSRLQITKLRLISSLKLSNYIFKTHEIKIRTEHNFFDISDLNRYRRKRSKVNASIFDSALSHTRRSNASEKREENTRVHF